MARKKKNWNASNPLYRWLQSKRARRKKTKVVKMARYRSRRTYRSHPHYRRGKSLLGGFKPYLSGYAYSLVGQQVFPGTIGQFGGAYVGGKVKGVIGAIAVPYVLNALSGGLGGILGGGSTSSNSTAW